MCFVPGHFQFIFFDKARRVGRIKSRLNVRNSALKNSTATKLCNVVNLIAFLKDIKTVKQEPSPLIKFKWGFSDLSVIRQTIPRELNQMGF